MSDNKNNSDIIEKFAKAVKEGKGSLKKVPTELLDLYYKGVAMSGDTKTKTMQEIEEILLERV